MNGDCIGFQRDYESGYRYCPLGYEPPEDMSWSTYCDMCRMGAEDAQELSGDMSRDEA